MEARQVVETGMAHRASESFRVPEEPAHRVAAERATDDRLPIAIDERVGGDRLVQTPQQVIHAASAVVAAHLATELLAI